MTASVALQNAIYSKLAADGPLMVLIKGIYDNPQQVEDPENNAAFPFITISTGNIQPWDDDTGTGSEASTQIHTWSRARHALEAKQVMDAIYSVLHRGTITINGQTFIGSDLTDQQNPQRDPDGITRHGVQTFRIIYEEA